jgi:hypothetical protein
VATVAQAEAAVTTAHKREDQHRHLDKVITAEQVKVLQETLQLVAAAVHRRQAQLVKMQQALALAVTVRQIHILVHL